MQSIKVIVGLFLLGCAFALDKPQVEQRVDLTDLNGVPSINAKDLKLNQQFGANVNSAADVNANLKSGGQQKNAWKVGATDEKASAGQHHAGYKQTDGSYAASASNGESGSVKTSQKGVAETFVATNNQGGVVDGEALKTGVDMGKVSGQDGTKPWDASWDGTFARANNNGNQAYVKKTDGSAQETFDLRGPGEAGTAYRKKNEDTVGYSDNRGQFFGKEYEAKIVEDNGQRSKTEVSNKNGYFSKSKYIIESDNIKNTASLSNGNGKIADVERIRASEGPCDEDVYNNKFSEDQFSIDEESVKVEVIPVKKANGELSYDWPSCMDISMMLTLPEGVDVHNLAAQVEVDLPMRQKFSCANQYNCGSYNCFYKDLCNKEENVALQKTVALNSVLSNADNNACSAQNGRKLPLKATVCPDDGATVPITDDTIKTNINLLDPVYEDVEATIRLFEINDRFGCSVFQQMFNKPKQVACRKGSVSYKVTFQNNVMYSNRDLNLVKQSTTTKAPVNLPKCPSYCKYFAFGATCQNCIKV